MPRLILEKGPDKGKSLAISGKESFIIGRETTAHIRLSDVMTSRRHFKIEDRPDGFHIIDLGSINGTFVNGHRIKDQLLKIDDRIQVGETLFSFLADVKEEKYSLIGQTIRGYKIMERLGRGGMGTVYKAEQLSLHRIVALKLLSDELVKDRSFINLFVQEARAAAQLNHPNIVQVYDVGKEKEVYYFSMEFMPGGNIQDRLAKAKKLPPEEALPMVLHAARGLEYAERKDVIHCDIKPDNLMIGEEDVIKIGDLGLARSIKAPKADQIEGGVFGTPHYVAPERVLGKAIDHRVDIYSLGCSFYRMLAGVTPYSGSSIREIVTKKVREEPRSLRQLAPALPDSLYRVVEKMLKRNPDERYQTATQLMADLEEIKAELSPVPAVSLKETAKKLVPAEKTLLTAVILPGILLLLSGLSIFAIVRHYYAAIRQPAEKLLSPPLQPPEPSQPRPANNYEEKLAAKYFGDAERFIDRQKNLKNPAILTEAIKSYEKIIKECPHSSLVPKAQAKINVIQATLIQLEKEQQRKSHEAKAARQFNDLIKNLTQERRDIINNVRVVRVHPSLNGWLKQLEKFKTQYQDTKSAVRAEEKIKELTTWRERLAKASRAYEETQQKVRAAIAQRNFKTALGYLDVFIYNQAYHNTLYDSLARSDLASVKAKAQDDYHSLVLKVHYYINQNDFDEARRLLNEALSCYGLPEIASQAQKELANLERTIGAKQKGEYEQLLQTDRKTFYSLLAEALEKAYQGSFKEAVLVLQPIQPDLQTKEYQTKLKDTIYEIESEQSIINALKIHINHSDTSARVLRGYLIKSANDQGIAVGISGVGSRIFAWHEITLEELYALISRGWRLSAKECFQLSILILRRGGTTSQTQELLQKAKSRLKPVTPEDKSLAALLEQYLQVCREERINQERKTYFIYEQANEYYRAKRYAKALDGFLTLVHRFQDTNLYNRNKADVKDKISLCRAKISK